MSELLDSRAIVCLLNGESGSAIAEHGLTEDMFESEARPVFHMIKSHFAQHNKLPGKPEVVRLFPGFKLKKATEPLAFYVAELLKRFKFRQFKEIIGAAVEGLGRAEDLDVDSMLKETATRTGMILQCGVTRAKDYRTRIDELPDVIARKRSKAADFPFGFAALDKDLIGLDRGDLVLIAGKAGCLTGDTLVRFNRGGIGRYTTLANVFIKFHGGGRNDQKWDLSIPTYVRSFNSALGHLGLNQVKDVMYSGVKDVYELRLGNGSTLKLTADHKVLTKRGFIAAGKLTKFDSVMVDVLTRHRKKERSTAAPKVRYGAPEFSKVVSLSYVGLEPTYDMEMAGDANFVANNMVVHNSGKTWLLLQAACNMWAAGYKILVISLEMSTKIIQDRLDAIMCKMDYGKYRRGIISANEERALYRMAKRLKTSKNSFDLISFENYDGGARTALGSVESLRACVQRYQPDFLYVDGLYLGMSMEWEKATKFANDFRLMLGMVGVPCAATTQAKQDADDDNPRMGDLAFTAGFQHAAAYVLMITRCGEGRTGELMMRAVKVREAEDRQDYFVDFKPATKIEVVPMVQERKSLLRDDDEEEYEEAEE